MLPIIYNNQCMRYDINKNWKSNIDQQLEIYTYDAKRTSNLCTTVFLLNVNTISIIVAMVVNFSDNL